MPIVKCICGRERLVIEGKKKKCRKCGRTLTAAPPPPAAPAESNTLTIEDLKAQHPEAVAEIVKAAQVEALAEAAGQDSKAVAETAALKLRIKNAIEKTVEKTITKRDKQINKTTVPKFKEQFPKLWGKIEKSFTKKSGKKTE